ncbi:MAG: hypothetical protein KGL60_00335 [Pseudomonas sp.]|jgi:hypothetical protein|uniref:hypothetical protein n=1 Tax=unclassified Pseudomonas TaxID=196821 RepID=UPI0013183191|nr:MULTISPECIES: hypothetical protein [unclassified Pseudomonas]MDP9214461.1 hypothetical protein [Pseudomonadota bacterium]MDE1908734.1 hypothetical protein [Pseudomonas sp.]MDE2033652.1 hypothetical protein [Pseudomonas sp.]MDE2191133.1 hypothetical protein [Pseudomonas sp.]MDE2554243.1 hypothetical protein [Pseudomonas sp.]
MSLKLFTTLWSVISPDRHPEREKAREREFIRAANSLKTLKVTPEGGMSIDPEELRDQIIASREQLKHLVHNPGAPSGSFKAAGDVQVEQEASPAVEAPVGAMDCIEVVAWRRLQSGVTVRYVCLQSKSTGRFAVATASLFTKAIESLPTWVDGNTNRLIANALQPGDLQWYAAASEAMDAWDAEL